MTVIVARRWIHHAQLELVPVIVPPTTPATEIVNPPAASIAARMWLDVRDTFSHPARQRLAVLTFDDGPYPVTTPVLIDRLSELRVPAEFFFIGRDAREQPAIASQAIAAGVGVGNHSLTHPEMSTLPYSNQAEEIADGAAAILAVTGVRTTYFRPPHGNYNADTIAAARAAGETVVLWDVDPGDWRTVTPDQIVDAVTAQAKAPAVIILHNGKDATVEALGRIVASYRQAGFTFVSLDELRQRVPLAEINDPQRVPMSKI
ncbi:MAG TPA: polysaccharide deacetylase family protein [Candidatus Eremiobacteraceae bacterium]|nr:polysaccharide deacetylase family protein [Candidatus Eremiobacteraceae bacterium]